MLKNESNNITNQRELETNTRNRHQAMENAHDQVAITCGFPLNRIGSGLLSTIKLKPLYQEWKIRIKLSSFKIRMQFPYFALREIGFSEDVETCSFQFIINKVRKVMDQL